MTFKHNIQSNNVPIKSTEPLGVLSACEVAAASAHYKGTHNDGICQTSATDPWYCRLVPYAHCHCNSVQWGELLEVQKSITFPNMRF